MLWTHFVRLGAQCLFCLNASRPLLKNFRVKALIRSKIEFSTSKDRMVQKWRFNAWPEKLFRCEWPLNHSARERTAFSVFMWPIWSRKNLIWPTCQMPKAEHVSTGKIWSYSLKREKRANLPLGQLNRAIQ